MAGGRDGGAVGGGEGVRAGQGKLSRANIVEQLPSVVYQLNLTIHAYEHTQTVGDRVGKNEKTKLVAKLQPAVCGF